MVGGWKGAKGRWRYDSSLLVSVYGEAVYSKIFQVAHTSFLTILTDVGVELFLNHSRNILIVSSCLFLIVGIRNLGV